MATIAETMLLRADAYQKQADEYQKKADAIYFTIAEMNGHGAASVAKRLTTTLASAIALRQEQRPPSQTKRTFVKSGLHTAAAQAARRQETANYLAQFDAKTPRPHTNQAYNSLATHGYIVKKGDGYVRSKKVFVVGKAAPNGQSPRERADRTPNPQKLAVARDEKARVVAQILKEKGPLTARELTQLVGERLTLGATGLTGIYAYVQRGYITRHKTKNGTTRDGLTYAFKAMPPEAGA